MTSKDLDKEIQNAYYKPYLTICEIEELVDKIRQYSIEKSDEAIKEFEKQSKREYKSALRKLAKMNWYNGQENACDIILELLEKCYE